jgi:AraC-like DNA-binding protein
LVDISLGLRRACCHFAPERKQEARLDPIFIDIALLGAVSGVGLILTVSIWMSRIMRGAQLAFTALIVSLFLHAWSALPETIGIPDHVVQVLQLLGSVGAFAVTWFILTIFLDHRRFAWLWLVSGAFITAWIVAIGIYHKTGPVLRAYALVHFLGLLAMVLYSGLDDLQDARRRIRPAMSSFLLIYCIELSLISHPLQDTRSIEAAVFQSAALFFLVSLFAIWALKANLSHWPGATAPLPVSTPSAQERSSEQSILIKRIQKAMDEGIWQTEGLTVAGLAQEVKAPEYQVRKAINQVLGYRNFASFINRARIDAAKARLSNLEMSENTILEIAYNVGFSSLGPFNRAFRENTGHSPSDFRKQILREAEI